jgi:thiol-disulfide isomerase/thioredoxin
MKSLILSALAATVLIASAIAADLPRDAEAILKEYEAVAMPTYDSAKGRDRDYVRTYSEARTKALDKKNALALELYRAHPDHERATPLMLARWASMRGNESERSVAEMEAFLKDHPDSPDKADVLHARALAATMATYVEGRKNAKAYINDFIKAQPKDERGAHLLSMFAMRDARKVEQLAIYRRIASEYAGSRSAKMAEGSIRRVEGAGKPIELTFTDAIKGETVSMKALQGKVVVIDFWATWCGPCIAEMPAMKSLYAKYKDQGVEFIGVSLDQPGEGLAALKKYVEENNIPWPQYYQGNGWDSEYSLSWGINGIPSLFIIDADGNLYSTEARAKLDSLIPELIKKRDQKT